MVGLLIKEVCNKTKSNIFLRNNSFNFLLFFCLIDLDNTILSMSSLLSTSEVEIASLFLIVFASKRQFLGIIRYYVYLFFIGMLIFCIFSKDFLTYPPAIFCFFFNILITSFLAHKEGYKKLVYFLLGIISLFLGICYCFFFYTAEILDFYFTTSSFIQLSYNEGPAWGILMFLILIIFPVLFFMLVLYLFLDGFYK